MQAASASTGYQSLQKVYEHLENILMVQKVAAEYDAPKKEQEIYMTALDRTIAEDEAMRPAYLWDSY